MGNTPYAAVYEMFLSRIQEDFYADPNISTQEKAQDMLLLLKKAIPKFPYCRKNLQNRNDEEQVFYETLQDAEIEVLSIGMKLEWIRRKINDIYLLRQEFSDKDFQLTSQASHLTALLQNEEKTVEEFKSALRWYNRAINGKPNFTGLAGGG